MGKGIVRLSVSMLMIAVMIGTTFTVSTVFEDDVYAASKKMKVTFKANKGTFAKGAKKTKSIKKGKKLGKLPKVTRSGYTFKGWYTKKSGGKKYTKNTKIKKKVTLYAHWKKKTPAKDTVTEPIKDPGYLTQEKYNKIVVGKTTYDEVKKMVGAEPYYTIKMQINGYGPDWHLYTKWYVDSNKNSKEYVFILFNDKTGKVVQRSNEMGW